jgi:hypothetical protein
MDFAPLGDHDGELKGIEFDSAPIVPDFAGATFEESTNIDNEYFPLIVGSHRVFEVVDEEEGDESDEDAEVVEENGDDDNVIDGEGFILDVLDETVCWLKTPLTTTPRTTTATCGTWAKTLPTTSMTKKAT